MIRFMLAVICWLVLAAPALAGYDEGVAAYDRGDYETAEREFRPLAEQGDVDAQFMLGRIYTYGMGVAQDYVAAVKWFRLVAEQGHAAAQYNLGIMYHFGRGVPQDHVQSYMWFNLAAAHGNEVASKVRDMIAARMTRADVSKAQRLAREWLVKHGKPD